MYGGRVQITKDERTSKMAASTFAEMRDILTHFEPESKTKAVDKSFSLPLISVEQAMKELLEMENEVNKKES